MQAAQVSHMQDEDNPHMSPSVVARKVTKSEKRLAFAVAMKNGSTIADAARAVGVNRNTGTVWARQIRDKTTVDPVSDVIASKSEVARTLTEVLRSPDTAPPYKVTAAAGLSKVLGYDAPSRSQVEVRQVPASVSAWLDSLTVDAIDVTPERAIETNARPALSSIGESQSSTARALSSQHDADVATASAPHTHAAHSPATETKRDAP